MRTTAMRASAMTAALLMPLAFAVELHDRPPPVTIIVGGTPRYVRQDTTFGQALREFHVRAAPGRLLDVEGDVLDPKADPGSVLLNGSVAGASTPLADGDQIIASNGVDSTEGIRKVVTNLKGRRPGDPQFTLGTARVEKVTTEGKISGKVVSIVYRPRSKFDKPPEVALTFDDGPWPGSSREILSILQRMHAKATFFVIGYLVDRYPQIVQAEIDAGMAIGNHSWDHPITPPFDQLEPHRMQTEMSNTNDVLFRRFGLRPTLFRSPGGSLDGRVIKTAEGFGMRVVQWDVDPRDWSPSATKASIVRNVLSHIKPGSIVDLHDGGGDQSATIRALPAIIRGIRKMGLKLVAMR